MTPARRSLRDYLVVEGSFAFVLLLPIAAVFMHRSYWPIAAIMAIISATRRESWIELKRLATPPIRLRVPARALAFSVLTLSLWIAVTSFWSPTPGGMGHGLTILGASLATYFIAAEIGARGPGDSRLLAIAFIAATLLAAALLFFEAHTNGYLRFVLPPEDKSPDRFKDITALGRGLAAVAPSLFPAAALLALVTKLRGLKLAGLLLALFIVALSAALELTIAANTAAVLAGTGAALLALKAPRLAIKLLTFAFIAALVLTPALAFVPVEAIAERTVGTLPLSWLQRLFIWRNAADEALQCLPLGCGADYARTLAAAKEMFALPGAPELLRLVPMHPHSVFMQVWLELGLPGVVLFFTAILAGGRLAMDAKLAAPVAAALVGGVTATLVYWSVEASIWQEWRLAALVIFAAGVTIAANLSRARA